MPKKINFQGKDILGDDVGFRIIDDGSITLEVEDGATLRMRPVVLSVLRTEEKNADGERVYVVQSLTHVTIVRPATEDRE